MRLEFARIHYSADTRLSASPPPQPTGEPGYEATAFSNTYLHLLLCAMRLLDRVKHYAGSLKSSLSVARNYFGIMSVVPEKR